jgi:hypothetical protein
MWTAKHSPRLTLEHPATHRRSLRAHAVLTLPHHWVVLKAAEGVSGKGELAADLWSFIPPRNPKICMELTPLRPGPRVMPARCSRDSQVSMGEALFAAAAAVRGHGPTTTPTLCFIHQRWLVSFSAESSAEAGFGRLGLPHSLTWTWRS